MIPDLRFGAVGMARRLYDFEGPVLAGEPALLLLARSTTVSHGNTPSSRTSREAVPIRDPS
jgi:hypothetical protein